MKIIDVISTAGSEHQIRFLLTAYVEAARYCNRPGDPAGVAYALPVTGIDDVRARIAALESGLVQPPSSGPRTDQAAAQEATAIFRAALQRLHALEAAHRRPTCMAA